MEFDRVATGGFESDRVASLESHLRVAYRWSSIKDRVMEFKPCIGLQFYSMQNIDIGTQLAVGFKMIILPAGIGEVKSISKVLMTVVKTLSFYE